MARPILKSMMTVSGFIMLSRVFGFARQVLITGVIGASGSPVADAFWAAFRFPNMFRRMLAEGAFQAAFIPLFQGKHVSEGDAAAREFAENVMGWLIVALTGLTALVMMFTPVFVTLLATGFREDPTKFDLTVTYTRIMFPYLACMSLVGLYGGMLNALHKFAAAAAAPLMLNIAMIVAVLMFASDDKAITGEAAAWSVFVGGLLQLLVLIIGAWRAGLRLKLRLPRRGSGMRRLLTLGLPGFIGASALQVNMLIGTNIASREQGAISWLMNADQLYQLPLAIIGIALGIVLMPSISRSLKEGKQDAAAFTMNRGVEVALLFAIPAAVALVVMPQLICAALYQDFAADALSLVGVNKSAFTDKDTNATGMALMIYGIGLPAFVMHKVLAAAFFAREDTKTPMKTSLVAIALNASLSIALFPKLGFIIIPMATVLASWTEVSLLTGILFKRGIMKPDLRLAGRAPRMVLAAAGMGAVLWFGIKYQDHIQNLLFGQLWLVLIAQTIAGLAIYGGLCLALGAMKPSDFSALKKS